MSKIQVFDVLFREPVQPVQVDLTDNTLWYGQDNSFPIRLAKLVQESPTASSCISVLSDFLEGNGFSDPTLNDKIINSHRQRFGEIHNLVSESYSLFEGFALQIKYTREAKISEIFHVPFENIRLNRPDEQGIISKVTVNPYYGTALWQKKYNKEYDLFNPNPKDVLAQMQKQGAKYKGQILYVAFTRPLSRFYPLPYYFSARHYMAIDAAVGEFHANNLDAGFFQNVLLKMVGNPDEMSTHPDDQKINNQGEKESFRTRGQRFEIEMQNFVGAASKTKMMVLWEQIKEQMPELQAFPSTTNENFFTALQDFTTQAILRATKIPAILANMSKENSLSDGNQMANATKVMHDRVAKSQNLLERTYKDLLTNFKEPFLGEIKIVNTNSFESMAKVEPLVWDALTLEEQREWISKNTDYPINENAVLPAPAPVNKFANILFTDYPEAAKENARRAKKFMDTADKKCGTPMGWRMNQNIIDGRPLSFKDIRRIFNYLNRTISYESQLFSDSCESVLYSAWGGRDMQKYCEDKIKMVND